jgi:putative FmdB family regulatory protein
MPIYEYRCPNGHEFEVFQSMSEDPVSRCRECGAPVERVFHPVAVHFKGSGFYTTDYARSKAKAASDGGAESGKKDSDTAGGKKDSAKDSGGERAKAASSD